MSRICSFVAKLKYKSIIALKMKLHCQCDSPWVLLPCPSQQPTHAPPIGKSAAASSTWLVNTNVTRHLIGQNTCSANRQVCLQHQAPDWSIQILLGIWLVNPRYIQPIGRSAAASSTWLVNTNVTRYLIGQPQICSANRQVCYNIKHLIGRYKWG